MLIAAIGDVHGCRAELDILLERVLKWFDGREGKLIFLGDLVDRGPDVRGVLDRVMNWDVPHIELILLRGNHEEMMIETVLYNSYRHERTWMHKDSGGEQTKISLGYELEDYARWLNYNMIPTYATPKHLFVHAGVNPKYSLDDQIERDTLWIRSKFLDHMEPYENGIKIVHGHTPTIGDVLELTPNRIGVDTGCVFGGKLTAVMFEDDVMVKSVSVPCLS